MVPVGTSAWAPGHLGFHVSTRHRLRRGASDVLIDGQRLASKIGDPIGIQVEISRERYRQAKWLVFRPCRVLRGKCPSLCD
jgi:hypothetical protein